MGTPSNLEQLLLSSPVMHQAYPIPLSPLEASYTLKCVLAIAATSKIVDQL